MNDNAKMPLPIVNQNPAPSRTPKPPWLRIRAPLNAQYGKTDSVIETNRLNTICEEAKCPNRGECWSHGTATFLLLGEICTRGCKFCSVQTGRPGPPDPEEPNRVADACEQLDLMHVVLTSVNRDDLPDGGANQFVQTVETIRKRIPDSSVEILIPDFKGKWDALDIVMQADISVLNHNLETVPRLYKRVRPGSIYERSLELLERARSKRPELGIKSGIMVGLGEERDEVVQVMRDLKNAGGSIMTIGQYLQPTPNHLPVERYVEPREFDEFYRVGKDLGFEHVESAPLVRSSYHAWKHVS